MPTKNDHSPLVQRKIEETNLGQQGVSTLNASSFIPYGIKVHWGGRNIIILQELYIHQIRQSKKNLFYKNTYSNYIKYGQ